jgi:hypothetical protein
MRTRRRPRHGPRDHARAVPPIDQVAQQDHGGLRRRLRDHRLDPRDQLLEQVQASVNIPHGIDPPSGIWGTMVRQPDASRKTGI